MKFIFIIQGEGRGHLTQAISLGHLLQNAGHTLCCVCVGKSDRRVIPAFFYEKIGVPVYAFESPNFVADQHNKGILIGKSISYNLSRLPVFLHSLKRLRQRIQAEQPDVLINFYDLLGGLYNLFYKSKHVSFYTVGHQYFLEHASFHFPESSFKERTLLRLANAITAFRADKKLALSLRDVPDEPEKKLFIVPPLLRPEVTALSPETSDFILAYVNMPGYAQEIRQWCETHPDTAIHCFWDVKDQADGWQPLPNLTFHSLNDSKFLEMMRQCRGYVSTAGFESVCEAMYLGKPVLLVPIAGQFEQTCNAADALLSGAGTTATSFDISKLLSYLPGYVNQREAFGQWLEQAERKFISTF